MEALQDKRINCYKQAQLCLNSFWIITLLLHFYLIVQAVPFTSSFWPLELLLLVATFLHILNLLIIKWVGFARLYSSFGCLAIENFCLFLLLIAAFVILKFYVTATVSSLLSEFLLCFFQSLIFFKCIYLRVKYLRPYATFSNYEGLLIRFKVFQVPIHSNTVCSICLDDMNVNPHIKANLIALPCALQIKHCFHFTCFVKWFQRSTECPICRGKHYLKTLQEKCRSVQLLERTTSIVPRYPASSNNLNQVAQI